MLAIDRCFFFFLKNLVLYVFPYSPKRERERGWQNWAMARIEINIEREKEGEGVSVNSDKLMWMLMWMLFYCLRQRNE